MSEEKTPSLIYLRTGYVIACISLIYLTVPLARTIAVFLRDLKLLKITVYLLLAGFIVAGIFFVIRYIGFRLLNAVVLTVFLIIYLLIIKQYSILVEKIHFIEYGFLAFLVYYTLSLKTRGAAVYPLSLFIVTIIGWGDEIIQYFLPERVYDNRDVFLNALSGALVLALLFVIEKIKDWSIPKQ